MRTIKMNGKYGFIDDRGKIVIEPIFDGATEFSDGVCFVKQLDKWSIIDDGGNVISKTVFSGVKSFRNGIVVVAMKIGEKDKWGFADSNGELIIAPFYDDADNFNDGLALVRKGYDSGFINIKGEYVIRPELGCESDNLYSHNLVKLWNEEGNGIVFYKLIDSRLVSTSLPTFHDAQSFSEGLAAVNTGNGINKEWGFMDEKGRFIITPQFELVLGFSEGLAPVAIKHPLLGYLWGYINKEAIFIIGPKYDQAFPFIDGIAEVYIDDKMGYINKEGKYIWEPTK